MDSPVRPYVWPSNRYTRTYTLALSASARLRAEGGSINNSLAGPSISPPPIRPGRRSPSRLYPATILISYPGKNIGYFFLGTGRDSPHPRKYGIFLEIRVNVKYHKHRSEEFNSGCAHQFALLDAMTYNLILDNFYIYTSCM